MAPQEYFVPDNPPGCPPDTSAIRIHVVQPGASRWGFQITARDSTGAPKGHLSLTDSVVTLRIIDSLGREYATQTTQGTYAGQFDSSSYWWINWVPEFNKGGKLWLYFSAVAADGDGTPAGDYVWAYSLPVWPISFDCAITMNGDVNLSNTITSADIIFMVNHVFKSGPAPAYGGASGDTNCDGSNTAADIIKLVNFVFKAGLGPCDICGSCCFENDDTWYCP